MGAVNARTVKYSIYDKSVGKAKYLGDTTSITMPNFEFLTEAISGAGINGEIDFPTLGQIGASTLGIALRGLGDSAISLTTPKSQHLEIRWAAYAIDDSTGTTSVVDKKIVFVGVPKKLDSGTLEANKAEESTVELEMLYYKLIIKGKVRIEIDKLNDVFKVDGVDYNAAVNSVL